MAAIREELTEARNEIALLETLEAEQSSHIEQTPTRLRETELQLAEAKTQLSRTAELDSARQEAKDKAVEAEALRAQVGELMAMLKPKLGGGRGRGDSGGWKLFAVSRSVRPRGPELPRPENILS